MYQLSIDHQGRSVTTTDHPDRDEDSPLVYAY